MSYMNLDKLTGLTETQNNLQMACENEADCLGIKDLHILKMWMYERIMIERQRFQTKKKKSTKFRDYRKSLHFYFHKRMTQCHSKLQFLHFYTSSGIFKHTHRNPPLNVMLCLHLWQLSPLVLLLSNNTIFCTMHNLNFLSLL